MGRMIYILILYIQLPREIRKKKIHDDLNGFLALLNIQFIFISYVMAIKIYSMFNMHDDFIFHIFYFSGDKPHACELCNKRFALACNLRAHMKTHEGKESILNSKNVFLFVFPRLC